MQSTDVCPATTPKGGPLSFLLVAGDFVRTGGMDMANYRLADFIGRTGNPVCLVAHRVDPQLLDYPNVKWQRAPRPLGSHLIGERFLRKLGENVADQDEMKRAKVIVNGGNCPLAGINWIHYLHASAPPQNGTTALRSWKNGLSRRLSLSDEARAIARARVIIANSNRTKNDLLKHYDIPEERIHRIYYGADPSLFHPVDDAKKRALRAELGLSPDKFIVAFVGALGDRRKGFDTLLEAWQRAPLDSKGEEAQLVVIGSGAELPLWQKRASASSFGRNSLRFLGFRRDVPKILQSCDAFVAPTRYEAFGLAVHEALCCGLPAVVSRNAGVAEIFPASLDTLLLNDPESVAELTTTLELLYAHRVKFQLAARELSAQLSTYTWDDMSRSILSISAAKI